MSHDPTEHVQEEIQHHAAHDERVPREHGHSGVRWITAAALTAAFLAAFAAVSGALATTHLTESTHKRIESNDKWSYYQSKSLKNYLLDTKDEILAALDHAPPAGDLKKIEENNIEKKQTKAEAEGLETLSKAHLQAHETFELAATMFHISIAMVAISVVAKRKFFWFVSIAGGAIGLYFFASALIHSPASDGKEHGPPAAAASARPGGETHILSCAGGLVLQAAGSEFS
jgi:hypothetical protein